MTTIGASYPTNLNVCTEPILMAISNMPAHMREALTELEGKYLDRREDLLAQIALSDDPAMQDVLAREIHRLDQQYGQVIRAWNETEESSAFSFSFGDGAPSDIQIKRDNACLEMERLITSSWDRWGTASSRASAVASMASQSGDEGIGRLASMPRPPGYQRLPEGTFSGSDTGSIMQNYDSMTPQELSQAMATNPEAFWAELGSMTMEDRGAIQMKLQMHLQQVNQMMTMLSQMHQAVHDTSKSIIGNMRV